MGYARRIGSLAGLVVALFAITGLQQAVAASFTAGKANEGLATSVLANSKYLTITGFSLTCGNAYLLGYSDGTNYTEQTVEPGFEKCSFAGFSNASVDTSGCNLTLKAATDGAGMATVNLSSCTAGGITITVDVPKIATCTVLVKNQSMSSTASYTNVTADTIRVQLTASTVDAEVTQSSGLCPLKVGTHSNATYTGDFGMEVVGSTLQYDA